VGCLLEFVFQVVSFVFCYFDLFFLFFSVGVGAGVGVGIGIGVGIGVGVVGGIFFC